MFSKGFRRMEIPAIERRIHGCATGAMLLLVFLAATGCERSGGHENTCPIDGQAPQWVGRAETATPANISVTAPLRKERTPGGPTAKRVNDKHPLFFGDLAAKFFCDTVSLTTGG